ncbi:MAG: TrmB family transcriptional regulator [Nitrososphaerales archaeon]
MVLLPISERARKALEGLGLTEYEIKAYTTLIEYGEQTASDLSRNSGVPYSKIYEVLNSLEEKGWVEVERSRPSRFYPKPPATCVEITKMRLEKEMAENESRVIEELTPIYEKRDVRERPEIWIIRGEYNILSKVKETISSCRKELNIAIPSISPKLANLITPTFARLGSNVKVRVLLSSNISQNILQTLAKLGEVRVRDQMFGGGVIADATQVILILGASGENESHLAIWSDHSGLAKFAKNYFDYLWSDSTTLEEHVR